MPPEPITVKFNTRDPTIDEMKHGPSRVLEASIQFYYFNGKEWKEQTAIDALRLTEQVINDLEMFKKFQVRNCWRWFLETMQKGTIQEEPIIAIASMPIIVKEI